MQAELSVGHQNVSISQMNLIVLVLWMAKNFAHPLFKPFAVPLFYLISKYMELP